MDKAHVEQALIKAWIDPRLSESFVNEYLDLEESFLFRKWKYTQLNGGRFCEVVARIIYTIDSKNLNLSKSVDECIKFVENEKVTHYFPERQGSIHICKVLKSVYKLRSQRGAVHVSISYSADEIDSKLVMESCTWLFTEILRIFWDSDKRELAEIVKKISRFKHPLVREYGDTMLVQSTKLTTEEEVLTLLYFSKEGLEKDKIVKFTKKDSSNVRKSLKKLNSGKYREVFLCDNMFTITDLGIERIEKKLKEIM